jgi:hypothetical protein
MCFLHTTMVDSSIKMRNSWIIHKLTIARNLVFATWAIILQLLELVELPVFLMWFHLVRITTNSLHVYLMHTHRLLTRHYILALLSVECGLVLSLYSREIWSFWSNYIRIMDLVWGEYYCAVHRSSATLFQVGCPSRVFWATRKWVIDVINKETCRVESAGHVAWFGWPSGSVVWPFDMA